MNKSRKLAHNLSFPKKPKKRGRKLFKKAFSPHTIYYLPKSGSAKNSTVVLPVPSDSKTMISFLPFLSIGAGT